LKGFFESILNAIVIIPYAMETLFDKLYTLIESLPDGLKGFIEKILDGIAAIPIAMELFFDTIGTAIQLLPDAFEAFFVSIRVVLEILSDKVSTFGENIATGFKALLDLLGTLWNNLSAVFASLFDKLGTFFSNTITAVSSVPGKIIDGIKSFFIPSEEYLDEKMAYLYDNFAVLGVGIDLVPLMEVEHALTDITVTMYGSTVTIVDMDLVDKAVKFFRPLIRGFIVLMMLIYSYNQFMGLIGQPMLTLGGYLNREHKEVKKDSK